MRKLLVAGMSLVMLGLGTGAGAQENEVTMDAVVVSASRIQENVSRVPAYVSVVTAEDIEKSSAQNVAELLRNQPGIHVSDISGNQRNYGVDLRGFGESSKQNVLLLVDGRRVNLDDLSGADWNLIPLERIARVEIIRGSRGSVLYGDNATSGVINIITKSAERTQGEATAAYGSYDTFKSHVGADMTTDLLSCDLTAGYVYSGGYRDNSDTIAKDAGVNLRFDPGDRLSLQVSSGYHYDDTRNPGSLFQSQLDSGVARTHTNTPDDFDHVGDYYLKAGLEFDLTADHQFKLETSYRNREKKSFGTFGGGYFDADTDTDIYTASPQLVFNHRLGAVSNRLIAGGDYSKSKQNFDNLSEFFGSLSQIKARLEKEDIAYFVHDELGIGEHLAISGGYRSDRAVFSYSPGKRILDEEAYSAGINYGFSDRSHVYGSYTRSFRYPVLDEQFSYFTSTVDTTLDPQVSDDIELGASVKVLKSLVATVNVFRIETEDEIFFNPFTYVNQNLDGTAIRQGAELGLAWQGKSLRLSGSYTRTETEVDGGMFDGKQIPFVPVSKATAGAAYQFEQGLYLGLDAVYGGQSYLISDLGNSQDKAEAYTVVNAKVKYRWGRYTFFADLNNLFNEQYAAYSVYGYNPEIFDYESAFYPSPEFNVLVGVTARFGGDQEL